MSGRRITFIALYAVAATVGMLWLAGFVFFAINQVNPFGQVEMLTWWKYWQTYGGDASVRPQLIGSILIAAAVIITIPIVLLIQWGGARLHGESRFANYMEIKAAGLMKAKGIIVGKRGRTFLMFSTLQFVSLSAPTRSGKGTGVVIPNLLSFDDSVVVLDVKGENWAITSKYRSDHGQSTYCFAPFSRTTHQWNPLMYVPDDPHLRIAEILSIGYMLYPRVGGGRETMWNDTARDLFVGLSLYLLESPELMTSIGEVLRQASGKGKPLKQHLQDLVHARNYDAISEPDANGKPSTRYEPKPPYDGIGEPPLSDKCIESLNRFIVAPDNTAGGILTTFTAPLTLWGSPIVDAATSGNDFDLRDIRRKRMSVYINIPVNKLPESDVLLQLFFSQLIKLNTDVLLGSSPELKHQCLLVLDEFLAPGYIPIVAKGSAYIAGYGLRMLTITQSKGQIAKPVDQGGYGREGAKELLDNHALSILYTPKDVQDANEYSEVLGYDTVKSQSRNIRKYWQGTETDQRRALMLPQELMRMSQKKQIVQLEGLRPIMCKKIRYYEEPVFIDRLKSVSPKLARLGKKLPTQKQLEEAWSGGELSAPTPTIDIDLFEAKRHGRKRNMTPNDAKLGVDLETVEIDLSAISSPEDSPMTDEQVNTFVNQFWGALPDVESEYVDHSTDEWFGEPERDDIEPIDLSVLKA